MVPLFHSFTLLQKLLVYLHEVWLCYTVMSQMILDTTEKSWLERVCEMSEPLKGSGTR